MTSHLALPAPPDLPGHTWRNAHEEDLRAIRELQLACAAVYDNHPDKLVDYGQVIGDLGKPPIGDTICCVNGEGRVVAFGWVRTDPDAPLENRTGLFGEVHPGYRRRGLGAFILGWTEARGRQLMAAQSQGRRAVLRIDFSDRRDDAIPVYERQGFGLRFHEYWMRRDIQEPIPDPSLPDGMRLVSYTHDLACLFVGVFNDSFSTRRGSGFIDLSVDEWIAEFQNDPDFRPHLTLLAMDGEEGAGFIVGEIGSLPTPYVLQEGDIGWVAQIGVRLPWRGRGVGSALLGEVLRGFRAEGLGYALLAVNRDNPGALRVYDRLGFVLVGDRVMYGKNASVAVDATGGSGSG